jgi:hypothetical protein
MTRNMILLLLVFSTEINGQLATINDKNGYTNVRKEKDINSTIVGRLYNEDVFLYDSFHLNSYPNEEWIDVYQHVSLDKIDSFKRDFYIDTLHRRQNESFICHGFIPRAKFIPISELRLLDTKWNYPTSSRYDVMQDSICLTNDSLSIILITRPFDVNQHKIDKGNTQYVQKIDGMRPIGTFGNIPRVEIQQMTLKINGKTVDIPINDYKDLYEPRLVNLSLHINSRGVIYIYMPGNSDGAGGYEVVWIINGNKYVKRYADGPG